MNLIENEEFNAKKTKTKKIMTIIIILIIFLLIVSVILLYMIYSIERNTLKLTIDNKSTSFASDMFVLEDDKLYVDIRGFAALMGYETYNGDYKSGRYSEETSNCYISSTNEIASYSLNSNTMYKKATTNEDYEYFDLDEPVKLINNKLYVIEEGIEIGTNSKIQFNSNNNQISVLSLQYVVNYYSSRFENAVITNSRANFNSQKALLYDLVIVRNTDGHYGVYGIDGREIIGTKYTSINFKEDSKEFTVTTDEGKMGILSANGVTKIEPNYTQIKQISKELNYYLVSNNNKYGVINQNGNIIIHLEYDKIGINENDFNANGIENPYILFDNCIPVMQNNIWGMFDVNSNQILPLEYDEIGCIGGNRVNNSNNVLIIPQYEAIVIGKDGEYGIINSSGREYVPIMLDSVYSITSAGELKYYMTFTRQVEENGQLVDRQETYDLEQYFEEHVVENTQNAHNNENTVSNEVTEQNVISNEVTGQNSVDTNAPTNNVTNNVALNIV